MKESDSLPEEIKCFICMKQVENYKILGITVTCKDMIITCGVAICVDDLNWVQNSPDAARAVVTSRLEALVEREGGVD